MTRTLVACGPFRTRPARTRPSHPPRACGNHPRDPGEVDERVLPSVIRGDEPEALLVAEPLHDTSCHTTPPHLTIQMREVVLPGTAFPHAQHRLEGRTRPAVYTRRRPAISPWAPSAPPSGSSAAGAVGVRRRLRRRLVLVRVELALAVVPLPAPASSPCRGRRRGRRRPWSVARPPSRCRRRVAAAAARRTCRRTARTRTAVLGWREVAAELALGLLHVVAPDLGRERAAGDVAAVVQRRSSGSARWGSRPRRRWPAAA